MTTRLPRLRRFTSFTVIGALFWSLSITLVCAQSNVLNSGFTLDFLKSEEIASVDEVVSNVVKATNRTSRPIRFNLDLASPAGWKVVNDLSKTYTVQAGDSLFVPVRLIPSSETAGNVNYFISATAYSEFGNALASSPWTLEIKKISSWKLSVSDRQVIFPDDADSATVFVRLQNEGNAIEKLRLTLTPDAKLSVFDGDWKSFRDNSIIMSLPVGTDTLLAVNVKISDVREKGYFFSDRPDDPNVTNQKRQYRLQIQAASTTEKDKVNGRRVDFMKLSRSVKFDSEKGSSVIPLTVELNSYNVLSNFTNFTLDARGEADLGRQRHLRYNYQSIITNNVVSGTDFLTSNQFIQYSSPRLLLAAGNIGENMGLLLNGQGAKGMVRLGKLELGGIYVTSANRPGRLAANDLDYYGGRLAFNFKRNSRIEAQYVKQTDNFNSKEGDLYRLKFDYRISKHHRLGLTGGYSMEQDSYDPDSVFNQTGYGAELRYGGRIGKMNVALAGTYNSETFLTLIRGSRSGNINFRYPLGNRKYITLKGSMNEAAPVSYVRGFRFESDPRRRYAGELQYEWRGTAGTFTLFPRYSDEEILDLKIKTKGAGMSYSSVRGREMRLYTKFFAGFSELPDYEEIEPFLVARWENRLKYKNLNVLARYNYGPASVTENFRVVKDQLNPQSLFLSAFANLYFRKVGVQIKPRLNSTYESVLARWRVTTSQDFSYYSKSGYIFTIGTELLMIKQGESPLARASAQQGIDGVLNTFRQSNFFLRIGVKKEFTFRRPGSKHYEMKVAVFKDLDGNGVRNKGEDFVQNVLIKVRGKSAITGSEGHATFSNLPIGNYIIESEVLGDSEGWFKSDDTPVLLEKDQTIFIPLTKGVQINGRVIVQKATYSALNEKVDVGSIRISAVGTDERVFSALTDEEGNFRIFVPFGSYEVKASGSGIDSRLQFAQSSYPLEINNADANYQLTFYLIEKNRRLNIKRFNDN